MSKKCCENCGNFQCAESAIAFWWDECVDNNFTTHWRPLPELLKNVPLPEPPKDGDGV